MSEPDKTDTDDDRAIPRAVELAMALLRALIAAGATEADLVALSRTGAPEVALTAIRRFGMQLDGPIGALGLDTRAHNRLSNAQVTTVRELVVLTEAQLKSSEFPGLGRGSIDNIKERLAAHGLRLGMTLEGK